MKTFKSVLILLLVTVTMAGYSSADGFKIKPGPKKIVSISFERAIKNPGLILAMYQQLNGEFLNNNQKTYTVSVVYDDSIYRITGTYDQWKMFFNLNFKLPVHFDKIMIG
jgi:hypothetical protein